jgi:hypothetical protein
MAEKIAERAGLKELDGRLSGRVMPGVRLERNRDGKAGLAEELSELRCADVMTERSLDRRVNVVRRTLEDPLPYEQDRIGVLARADVIPRRPPRFKMR